MDQTRLDAIRARCEAATPGPWTLTKDGRYEDHDECRIDLPDDNIELCRYENGEFIAHARTDVPDLLAEIAALRAELDAAKRDLTHTDDYCAFSRQSCVHNVKRAECGLDCEDCTLDCTCRACFNGETAWEWRGPEVEKE